ncbi:MAG: AI-2E family transporter [Patescibacteria group bacterium]
MELRNYNVYFLLLVLLGVSVLTFFIFKPFLIPCLLAAILAHLFYPVYKKLSSNCQKRRGLSATLVMILVFLVIVTPLVVMVSLVSQEAQGIFERFTSENNNVEKLIRNGVYNLSHLPFWGRLDLEKVVNQDEIINLVKSFSKNTLIILQGAYESLAGLILNLFIMFFALFYFLIDGEKLIKRIKEISPIRDKYENVLLEKFNAIIRAIMRETFLIALIQGALSGVLFWATGVVSPITLGIIAGIVSFIPSVGAGLVWLPVGIAMLVLGYPIQGIIIILVGALVISTVDNVLRPKLMGKSSQVHPLLILLSTLGGLLVFGLSGFIVGPIVMALFLVLWEIYVLEFKTQLKKFNA